MDGRSKTIRLCMVFAFAGVLTVMCLARTSVPIPANISHYIDIIMAVLMIVLMLCVLELCLGVEICAIGKCFRPRSMRTRNDIERSETGGLGVPISELCEPPPSYEVIMAERGEVIHTGGGKRRGRRVRKTSESLKRDLCVYSRSRRYVSESDANPHPVRLGVSPAISETSFMTTNELWLSVDSLPTYEEAVGRLREKEAMLRLQDPVGRLQDEEIMTWLREEALARLEEQVVMRMQQQHQEEKEEEEMTVIDHQEEEEEGEEEPTARLKDDRLR